MTSAAPKSDVERALELTALLADPKARADAFNEFGTRQKAAEEAEAKARNAVSEAQGFAETLKAKEAELQAREAEVAAQKDSLSKERTAFNQARDAENQRLAQLADSLNTKSAQQDTEHKAKMENLSSSFAEQQRTLNDRSAQIEKLAAGIEAREKKAAADQARADATQKEYDAKIAALRNIVMNEQGG